MVDRRYWPLPASPRPAADRASSRAARRASPEQAPLLALTLADWQVRLGTAHRCPRRPAGKKERQVSQQLAASQAAETESPDWQLPTLPSVPDTRGRRRPSTVRLWGTRRHRRSRRAVRSERSCATPRRSRAQGLWLTNCWEALLVTVGQARRHRLNRLAAPVEHQAAQAGLTPAALVATR
jgi:hypothetical protein